MPSHPSLSFSLVLAACAALSPSAAPAQAAAPLTLEQAVQFALQHNFEQRRAAFAAGQIEQDQRTARAAILPRLDFNASAARSRVGGGNVLGTIVDPRTGTTVTQVAPPVQIYPSYTFGLQARQLLFDGGKWWNNLAAADANMAGSRANLEEQKLNTTYTTEQRFLELVRQQRQLQVLSEAAARSRDQAGFAQRLFEGGRATQADVYQARANRDTDEINRLGQEARVELARQDLAQTIGADPAEPLTVAEPPGLQEEPAVPGPPRALVEKALAARPSLKAFQLFVEAQRRSLAAARGDYYPVVSLNGAYQRQSRDFGDVTASPEKVSQLSGSINLNWNLFQGFSTDAAVRRQEYQVALSENDLMNGRRGVASDVERAVAQLSGARAQAGVAAQAVGTAKDGLQFARARQQVGLGTQLEVRDAELKLTQSQLARINALIDGRESEAALKRAVGG
ncbi:MAG: alkaline protease secretion protein AprF [Myxococcales bacterium]